MHAAHSKVYKTYKNSQQQTKREKNGNEIIIRLRHCKLLLFCELYRTICCFNFQRRINEKKKWKNKCTKRRRTATERATKMKHETYLGQLYANKTKTKATAKTTKKNNRIGKTQPHKDGIKQNSSKLTIWRILFLWCLPAFHLFIYLFCLSALSFFFVL